MLFDAAEHSGKRGRDGGGARGDALSLADAQRHDLQVDGQFVTGVIGEGAVEGAFHGLDLVEEELPVLAEELGFDASLHGGGGELEQAVRDEEADVLFGPHHGEAMPALDSGAIGVKHIVPGTDVLLGLLFVGENGAGEGLDRVVAVVVANEQEDAAVKPVERGIQGECALFDESQDALTFCGARVELDARAALGGGAGGEAVLLEEGVDGRDVVAHGPF